MSTRAPAGPSPPARRTTCLIEMRPLHLPRSDERECPLCLEPYKRICARLPCCGAAAHARCLKRWESRAKTCPFCRAII